MPLDDLYQQDTDRALDAMSLRPAPAPAATRSAWGAPWRAIKAAAADVAGSTADVLKAYGAASATTLEADPVARATIGDNVLRQSAADARQRINSGEAMTSATGQAARAYSRSLRPDPATASTAEQIVFNVVRPLSKLVAGGVVAGPFGIAGMAGEEGLTTAEDLRQQGVDFSTRTAVGTLTAGVTGVTAALPLVGPSLKATAGLYVVGGPGAFIAQQAATRAILEQADYQALAQQYDPLDPVGLAVSSLIPLPFAAHGAARNVGVAGAGRQIAADMAGGRAPDGAALPERVGVTPDDVDATLTHNLTLQADQHQAINAAVAGEQMAQEMAEIRALTRVPDEPTPLETAPAKPAAEPAEATSAPALDQNRLTDTETPLSAPKADPVQQAVAARVQALEQVAGDMPIRIDDSGNAVTVRDEMARIRRELVDGTDAELGTVDADLLRVAAECALSLT